jgi:tripartite-type tricarboxylate transporter receptor subunit TctC
VKSVKELIALAKAKPGTLDYASAALGTSNHIAAELFKSMAKVNLVRVTYKGLGAALNDVLSGQVPILFSTSSVATVHVKANRLRALGVTTQTRLTAFPDLPTIAEAALPGYESMFHNGILAPAGTPPAIIGQLNQAITRALANPEIKDKIEATGSVVVASSPDEFAQKMRREIETIGKVIKEAGIRGD